MRLDRRLKSWLAVMAGIATMGFVALPAQAGPAGDAATLRAAGTQGAQGQPEMQKVHWDGRRYRRDRHYYYGPRYRHRHYYEPGFRFYYGPRHHHHNYRRHHHRW